MVVDQGADEAQFLDAPGEFRSAGSRLADGQDGEAGEAIRVLLDGVRELVVRRSAFSCRHGAWCVRHDL